MDCKQPIVMGILKQYTLYCIAWTTGRIEEGIYLSKREQSRVLQLHVVTYSIKDAMYATLTNI